jgi:hypothetical protein
MAQALLSSLPKTFDPSWRTNMNEDVTTDSEPVLGMDLDVVTHVCVCGSDVWNVLVKFEDYEISWYTITMYCANCGSKAKAPTPVDRPETSL